MYKSCIVLAALFSVSAPALAKGLYADAGYTFISIDVEDESADLGALSGHVGYNINDWFAVEGEGLVGVEDETVSVGGFNASAGLNYLVGAYAKGQYPVRDNINLHARVGLVYAEVEAELSGPGVSGSDSDGETGVAFGAGAEYALTPAIGIRGDYTRYDFDGEAANALTAAAVFRF